MKRGCDCRNWLDLDDEDVNFVNQEMKVTGKGNKQRIVPFGDELKNTLTRIFKAKGCKRGSVSLAALLLSDKGGQDESCKCSAIS